MSQSSKRIVFMATGDIAIPSFSALLGSEYEVVALVTQPDRPVGRKQELTPPAIKVLAEQHGIPVLQPERVRTEGELEQIAALQPDMIVVMAYGQLLPQALLDMPRVACINLHASLLPRHRGASCIQSAIDLGDHESGVTVMHVSARLDEGDVILRQPMVLDADITGGELHEALAQSAPEALLVALNDLFAGVAEREVQDSSLANYAPKLMRNDGELDWSMTAEQLGRRIRAYDPWPGTSTSYTDAKGRQRRLKIFPPTVFRPDLSGAPGEILSVAATMIVACGEGALELTACQPDGSRRMDMADFIAGGNVTVGTSLGLI